MDEPIRKLDEDQIQARADRAEEESASAYEQAYGKAIKAQHHEYMTEFGDDYRAKHPFQPDTTAAHEAAMKAIK